MGKGHIDRYEVTVLMPVFNAEVFLSEAIRSVLKQSYANFEFLIIDDGSVDKTVSIVESFKDKRIHLVQNGMNRGVAWSLNLGLSLAKGKYIARMDGDDICHPERLKKQVKYMEQNPFIGVVGSWVRYFGTQPPVVDHTPFEADVVAAYMVFDNPLYHPTVLIRKAFLEKYDLRYDSDYSRSEDYDLWLRAVECFPLVNLPEPLLKFRCHDASVTSTASKSMKEQACLLLRRGLSQLGIEPSKKELLFHYSVAKGQRMESLEDLAKAEKWLGNLVQHNKRSGAFKPDAFQIAVGMIWSRLCRNSAQLGISSWKMSKASDVARGYRPPLGLHLRFLLSIFFNFLKKI